MFNIVTLALPLPLAGAGAEFAWTHGQKTSGLARPRSPACIGYAVLYKRYVQALGGEASGVAAGLR